MSVYNRTNPFLSKITSRHVLNCAGNTRETWHFVLDLADSSLDYMPGDSIGILPENDPMKVKNILEALDATSDVAAFDHLLKKVNLAQPTKKLFQEVAKGKIELEMLLEKENEEALKKYLSLFDVEEFVLEHKVNLEPAAFCQLLAPLLPRFYSIASAKSLVGKEVHLTVARLRYEVEGKVRHGICSQFLCDIAKVNETHVPIYVQQTRDFRLPQNDETPIIMIGPGTGVAPFRAFMQERVTRCAPKEKAWLFFGERNRKSDFFYEEFWSEMQASKMLRVDVAFSRDQDAKIYVQDRMWQNKAELWQWLSTGAIIYVCGDASRMAKDVEQTIHKIAQSEGALDEQGARDFVKKLRQEKRYIKDVY